MNKNLVHINWKDINRYEDNEISYFLFLEGKSLEAICKIRNLDKSTVQTHIIEGKIKYRFLVKSSSVEELFKSISSAGKEDRILFIKYLKDDNKKELTEYIRKNYADMSPKSKEKAVWILGEMKTGIDVLKKASVHKFSNIRRLAVSAMGKLEDVECEIALIRALEDDNPQVILYAIKALNKLKSKKALKKLSEIKVKEEKDYIKKAIDEYFNEVNNEF